MSRPYTQFDNSLPSFIDCVKATLSYWLNIHDDAEAFAEEAINLLEDCFSTLTLDVVTDHISNGYNYIYLTSDEVKEALIKEEFSEVSLYRCSKCGMTLEDSYCDDCDSDDCEEDTTDEVKVDYFSYADSVSTSTVREVIKTLVFPQYRKNIECVVGGVIEEVRKHIEQLESAPDNFARVEALIRALSIAHSNGNIMEDYACNVTDLEFDDILTVRENGLESLFDREEVKAYLS